MSDWMGLDPDDRTAILIDGANLYRTAKTLGFDIDYKALLERAKRETRLVRAAYYTAMQEDPDGDFSPLRPLVDFLDYNGFQMVTKPAKSFVGQDGTRRFRGSTDIELAVDMVTMAGRLDTIVLFSGNGDFRHAIERCQSQGCKVVCVSTTKSQPPIASDDIRRCADQFVEITDIQDVIGREPRGPRSDAPRADEA